jgi:urease accessory protein
MTEGLVSLLALADSRLPAGGHAHSGGVEPAIASGLIRDLDDLGLFLRSRLWTAGLVSAGLAAAACHRAGWLESAACPPGAPEPHEPPAPNRVPGPNGAPAPHRAPAANGAAAPNRTFREAVPRSGATAPEYPTSPVRQADTVWRALDAEADARTASPALRLASRQQGRALLRAGRAAWPSPLLDDLATPATATAVPNRTFREAVPTSGTAAPKYPTSPVHSGPHHAVALGAVGAAAGCDPAGVAHVAGYLAISGPAAAAVRLRGYDPFAVHALVATLAPDVTEIAERAAEAARGPLRDLPCATAPRLDLLAELHAASEVRLFAS